MRQESTTGDMKQPLPIDSHTFVKINGKYWNADLLAYDKNDPSKAWVHYYGQKKNRKSKIDTKQLFKNIPPHNDNASTQPIETITEIQTKIRESMKPLKNLNGGSTCLESVVEEMKEIAGNKVCHAFFGQSEYTENLIKGDELEKIFLEAKKQLEEFEDTGVSPNINWHDVEKKWEKYLTDFLGCDPDVSDIKVICVHCPTVKYNEPSTKIKVAKESNLEEPELIDLDKKMSEEGADFCLVHTDVEVLFAAPSERFCLILVQKVIDKLSVSPPHLNQIVIDGIQVTAEDDANQTSIPGTKRKYTANYGVADRSQGKATSQTSLRELIGTRRLCAKSKGSTINPLSFDRHAATLYYENSYKVFFQRGWKSFDKVDGWYDKRSIKIGKIRKTKKPRNPRVSFVKSFKDRKSFDLPYLRRESCPEVPSARRKKKTNIRTVKKMAAAQFETCHRTIAEMILLYVFGCLPRIMHSFIACDNYKKTFEKYDPHNPAKNVARPLPKGSLGIELEKPLHDDKNGLESLGVWRCLDDDPQNKVNLIFKTTNLCWSIRSSKERFAIFNGNVPHKTKATLEVKPSSKKRVHHTCYMKPLHEYISLHLFSDRHRGNVELFDK